jgi:hypothetical protein
VVGKCPRAFTAPRMREFTLSIVICSPVQCGRLSWCFMLWTVSMTVVRVGALAVQHWPIVIRLRCGWGGVSQRTQYECLGTSTGDAAPTA